MRPKVDWVIVEVTNANWPPTLPYRGRDARRGYDSEQEAWARIASIAAHDGGHGGTYRVRKRTRVGGSVTLAQP